MAPRKQKKVKAPIVVKDIDLAVPVIYHQRHLSTIHALEIRYIAYDPNTRHMLIGTREGEELEWMCVSQKLRDRFANAMGYESFAEAEYWQRIFSIPEPPELPDFSKKWETDIAAIQARFKKT